MELIDEIRQALKMNDPAYMDAITEIKQRHVKQGTPIEEIRELIRNVIHEDSKPAAMPEPEAPQPVTPEPPPAVQDKRAERVPKRTRQSYEPEEGMTPSGTKKTGAAGGRTIFDFIDNK